MTILFFPGRKVQVTAAQLEELSSSWQQLRRQQQQLQQSRPQQLEGVPLQQLERGQLLGPSSPIEKQVKNAKLFYLFYCTIKCTYTVHQLNVQSLYCC
jgi:hypothetical protein